MPPNLCSLECRNLRCFAFYANVVKPSGSPASNRRCWTITNERLVQAGYYSILDRYESLHLCYPTVVYRRVRWCERSARKLASYSILWLKCAQINFVFHCFGWLVDFHKHDHVPWIIPHPLNCFDISFAEHGCFFKFPALYSADSVHGGMYLEIVSRFGFNQFDTHSVFHLAWAVAAAPPHCSREARLLHLSPTKCIITQLV